MDIKHDSLAAIGNTPLIRLRHASEITGCEILGKAEFMNPGQSVKDRAALFIVKDAIAKGTLKPGGVIVEGTAGNTGIGLAVVGLNYAGAASAAFFVAVAVQSIGLAALAGVVPLFVIFHFAMQSWTGRLEDAERHVKTVDRLYLSTIEAFSTAMSQTLLVPAIVLFVGAVIAVWFVRPSHISRPDAAANEDPELASAAA